MYWVKEKKRTVQVEERLGAAGWRRRCCLSEGESLLGCVDLCGLTSCGTRSPIRVRAFLAWRTARTRSRLPRNLPLTLCSVAHIITDARLKHTSHSAAVWPLSSLRLRNRLMRSVVSVPQPAATAPGLLARVRNLWSIGWVITCSWPSW